jgi:hypothetical protein
MGRMILLDSGRLGMLVRAPSKSHIVRCLTWLKASLATGALVVIPEIAHYEMRREFLRILQGYGAIFGLSFPGFLSNWTYN